MIADFPPQMSTISDDERTAWLIVLGCLFGLLVLAYFYARAFSGPGPRP